MKKVRFSGMGESRQGRVAWVAAVPASPPPLHSLHTSLESLQRDHGFPPSSRQACWLAPAEPTARGSRGQTRSNCAENVGHSTIPQFFFSVLALRYPSAVHLQCGPLSRQIRRRGTEQKREKKRKKTRQGQRWCGGCKKSGYRSRPRPRRRGQSEGRCIPRDERGARCTAGRAGPRAGPSPCIRLASPF